MKNLYQKYTPVLDEISKPDPIQYQKISNTTNGNTGTGNMMTCLCVVILQVHVTFDQER